MQTVLEREVLITPGIDVGDAEKAIKYIKENMEDLTLFTVHEVPETRLKISVIYHRYVIREAII